jgi:hypothetical protein
VAVIFSEAPFIDDEVRPTISGAAVDDASRIPFLWINCSKLISAPSRPAVFPQEHRQIAPCATFLPGVSQRSAPAASGLDICRRGGVDDELMQWVRLAIAANQSLISPWMRKGNTLETRGRVSVRPTIGQVDFQLTGCSI